MQRARSIVEPGDHGFGALLVGLHREPEALPAAQRGIGKHLGEHVERELEPIRLLCIDREIEIVVARLVDEDEATVKYYRRQGHLVRLEPANAAYRPIEIDLREQSLAIEGLAVGVIRTSLSRSR